MNAAPLVAELTRRGLTVATAESLTGGLLCAALVDVPGASAVVRGGVVAYATPLKAALLGVDEERLHRTGPVDPLVAEQMARGARERLGADIGIATTGVAGPDAADGFAAGTVFLGIAAAWLPGGARHRRLALPGDRAAVRSGTVLEALAEITAALATPSAPAPGAAAEHGGPLAS